ncbi:hypothetical protein BDV96DRAFT_598386 [Lophiotrema nucula]|uniref:Uncharacterized protein n=1 Tax=Lophiotrema nucula TaxID=690887 RepID=A0A6A5ZAD6_9PLEO|nr:hypothetical protein BDV96DRAFT_598386 [Lophiotrema nucula]
MCLGGLVLGIRVLLLKPSRSPSFPHRSYHHFRTAHSSYQSTSSTPIIFRSTVSAVDATSYSFLPLSTTSAATGSQLFTMSSPASPVPTPASDKATQRTLSTAHYRVSQYYDGKAVRVQESRRRPHVIGYPKQSMSKDFLLFDTESKENTAIDSKSTNESSHSRRSPKSTSMQLRTRGETHVTRVKPCAPRAKAQAVIIHAPSPTRTQKSEALLLIQKTSMPTPPPTPKLGRLSTPELSDLDDAPFCDCCVQEPIVKYCASCGCSLFDTTV